MVGPTNKIHGETHYSCERREYAFMVLREYLIIFHEYLGNIIDNENCKDRVWALLLLSE